MSRRFSTMSITSRIGLFFSRSSDSPSSSLSPSRFRRIGYPPDDAQILQEGVVQREVGAVRRGVPAEEVVGKAVHLLRDQLLLGKKTSFWSLTIPSSAPTSLVLLMVYSRSRRFASRSLRPTPGDIATLALLTAILVGADKKVSLGGPHSLGTAWGSPAKRKQGIEPRHICWLEDQGRD